MSEWISVEAQIPPEGLAVLWWCPSYGGVQLQKANTIYAWLNPSERPTHWMPVPPPPEL